MFCPLARREAPAEDRRPEGEGANIDRRLVPLSREMHANPISHRVYLFIYIYASTVVLMRAALEFWPW